MRRYLCVGINAYSGLELAGCVNDAFDWSDALGDRGFVGTVLTDAEATLANVTAELRDALATAKSGDTVVFQFSGHGTWVPDLGGDEADGRDEALVPYDFGTTTRLLTDDVLYRLVEDNRGDRVKTLFISDSCHSGTVSRAFATNDHVSEFGVSLPGLVDAAQRPRFMPPARVLPPERIAAAERVQNLEARGRSRTGAALLSGCRDDQVSYDAWFGERANGAFTHAALEALRFDAPKSLQAWIEATRTRIQYDQDPQVSGTWWQRKMTKFI